MYIFLTFEKCHMKKNVFALIKLQFNYIENYIIIEIIKNQHHLIKTEHIYLNNKKKKNFHPKNVISVKNNFASFW